MAPDSTVEVRGLISARAEAQPVTVRLDREGVQDGPVVLKLVKRPTVSLRGRVLGPGGQPVAGARCGSRSGRGMSRTPTVAARTRRSGPAPTARSGRRTEVPRSDQYWHLGHRPGDGAGLVGLGEGAGRRTARRDPPPAVAAAVGRRPGGRRRRSRAWPGPRSSSPATGRGGRVTRPTPTAGSRSPGSSTRRRSSSSRRPGIASRAVGSGRATSRSRSSSRRSRALRPPR